MIRKLLFGMLTGSIILMLSCSGKRNYVKNSGPEAIKVMSYNVHHCNPPAKPDVIDLDGIAAVINEAKPDFVGLQEIDVNTTRSGVGLNQAKALAEKTKMNFYFAKAIDYQGGEYGVAILSKYTIHDARIYRLSSDPSTKAEPRVLVTAKVVLPSGKAIRFANTHLDATGNPVNREMQIAEINAIAAKETLPFVITGDFNATVNSTVISEMDKVFTRTCVNCAPTIPADRPLKCIDFVAFTTRMPFHIRSHQVVVAPEASDHLPVISVLDFKP
jgi:endonuclease/exonuclease/phosphatase family metal-dependent hydrolase